VPRWSAAIVFFLLTCLPAWGQNAIPSRINPVDRPVSDRLARERWHSLGRNFAGRSAAALRFRAYAQKVQLRSVRAARPLTAPASAWQSIGPAPLASDATGLGEQDYNWVSGRATSVALDPDDVTGNTVYLGAAYGGLWKSTNAANLNPAAVLWAPLIDDQPTLAVGAVTVLPLNGGQKIVLVGTGETNNSTDSYYGLGILRSTGAGSSWSVISQDVSGTHSFAGVGFSQFAYNPASPNVVVAAAAGASQGLLDGLVTSATANLGIYTSTDYGQTWTSASLTDAGAQVSASSVTSVVYSPAAGAFFAAVRFHGFYTSTDGLNWSRLANQPGGFLSKAACPPQTVTPSACPMYRGELSALADPNNPSRNEVYVWYVDSNNNDQGIWESTNGGLTWSQLDETGITACGDILGGCGTENGAYNLALEAVADGQATDLYAGAINLYKCTISSVFPTCSPNVSPGPPPDATFQNLTHVYGCPPDLGSIAHVHPAQHAIASMLVGGNSQSLLYFANDGGLYRALDGYTGLTTGSCSGTNAFDSLNQTLGSLTEFNSLAQSPAASNVILGGTQGNGSAATSSAPSGSPWLGVNSADGGYSAINPDNPEEWFTANTYISIQHCTNGIGCHEQDFQNDVIVSNQTVGGDQGAFYTPYILDPQNSSTLLVGTCRVWRGSSSGSGFTVLSNNFDTGTASTCNGNEVNLVRSLAAGGSTVSGMSNVLYAATDGFGPLAPTSPSGGNIWVTTNAAGGATTWNNRTGNINPGNFPIASVVLDSSDSSGATAYVGIMGFHVSHVWKTTNAGLNWTDFTANLPDNPVNALLVDATTVPPTLFAGTDVGVFSTSTASPSWIEVGPAPSPTATGYLPNLPVTALAMLVSGNTRLLRASTYGRGIWQVDLSPNPDYQMSVSNNPQTVFANQSTIFDITLSALNGFSSSVNLTCTGGAPSSCLISPSNPVPMGTATVSAQAAAGTYNFDLHGAGTDLQQTTHDLALTLNVIDFAVSSPAPSTISMGTPATASTTFQITASGAFDSPVNLSLSGLPAGASASFQPGSSVIPTSSSPVSMTLTISTTSSVVLGSYPLTLTASGTQSGQSKTVTENLTLAIAPDFSVAISNPALEAGKNVPATFVGSITAINGYKSSVTLSCGSGAPPNCVPNPATVVPSAAGTPFVVTVSSGTVATYSFNIVAQGSDALALKHQAAVSFTSTSTTLPSYTLTISNPLLATPVGSSGVFTGTLTALNGYNSAVSLNCSAGSPPNCTPVPEVVTPTPGGAAFTVIVNSPTAASYGFSITGTGIDPQKTIQTAAVSFSAVDFAISNSSSGQTIQAGASASYNLTLSPLGGNFAQALTLACSDLPAGSTCSFTPAQISAGSSATTVVLKVTTASTSPAGTYTVQVNASEGSLTHSTTVPLTVQGGKPSFSFTLNVTSGSQTVSVAQTTAAYNFTATPSTPTFPYNVQFSCSGLPVESSCAFTPAQISSGSGATPVTMAVTITLPSLSRQTPLRRSPWMYAFWLVLPFGFVLILGTKPRRNCWRFLVLGAILGTIACAGGTGTSSAPNGTPTGTYTITIIGTAGSLTASAQVTLIVQ
jgi:hypothetical protein